MKSSTASDIALSALAILIPPTLVGAGQLAWSMLSAEPAAQRSAPAPAAPTPATASPAPASPPIAVPEVALQAGRAGPVEVSARMDRRAVLAGGDGVVHVALTLKADPRAGERRPTDLVVVLDRSGSMEGAPLEDARDATRAIIGALRPEDRFALVTYDDEARLDLPLGLADDGSRSRWLRVVDRIDDGGSTNMSGGLDLGLSTLREAGGERARRLILISDGMPNAGDPSPAGLLGRARASAERETPLTAVGVGLNFNEELMQGIADAGAGNYHYVRDTEGLAAVFRAELDQATATVASGVTVRLRPEAGVTLLGASGYPIQDTDQGQALRVGALAGGQTRTLWLSYRVDPSKVGAELDLGDIDVVFEADGETLGARVPGERAVAVVSDPAAAVASLDVPTWQEAVLTEEYNALRQQVAEAVRAGDQARARDAIQTYRARTEATNAVVGSAAVSANLSELSQLEAGVADSFTGADQQAKQNAMSKGVGSEAYKGRRKGQLDSLWSRDTSY